MVVNRRSGRALLLGLLLSLILTLGSATVALAHGENSQEGFLRMETAAFYDVQFSSDKVKQGEQITITGKVKVLETWPSTLGKPEVGYINVIVPGPTFFMRERTVNGQPQPGSILIEKGGVYEFKLVMEGRRPGNWHLHPVLYVEDSGGLIGPGQWTTVEASAVGFSTPVKLATGETVDLQTYAKPLIFWFSFLGFIPGVIWMLWWTLKHRTVTNLAVTSQIPLNDPGEDIGLITKADHKVSTALAGVTVLLLVAGWFYIESAYPTRLPQQVRRLAPVPLAEPPSFAKAKATTAIYDPDTGALVIEAQVTNTGKEPMQVTSFVTSNLTFAVKNAGAAGSFVLNAEPAVVKPGETAKVKLTMQDKVWAERRLISVGKAELGVAGLLALESGGQRNMVTISSAVFPKSLVAAR